MNDRNENFWRTYQTVNEWTRFSDAKAGALLTVYGVLYTLIYSNANDVYLAINSSKLICVLTVCCFIASFFSMYFAFKCLNPRLSNPNPRSTIYFGHISQNVNYNAYLSQATAVFNNEDQTSEHLAEQIFINSTIAWKKFKNVCLSIRFFFAVVVLSILIIITYLLR